MEQFKELTPEETKAELEAFKASKIDTEMAAKMQETTERLSRLETRMAVYQAIQSKHESRIADLWKKVKDAARTIEDFVSRTKGIGRAFDMVRRDAEKDGE